MTTTNLRTTLTRLTEAACQDAPQRPSVTVGGGAFRLTIKGNRSQWVAMCDAAGVPQYATQTIDGDTLRVQWRSYADEIFGADGLIAQQLGDGYEVRAPQLHMARLVQRAIEMDQPAVIEAGTGVGKSFAYAAIAMAMDKRIVISTSNKVLQMQLYRKDIPFLQRIFPGKTVALAVGKSNYVCKAKVEKDGAVSIADPALRQWYYATETGNVEELDFAPDWQTLAGMTVDDECIGKHCPLYAECFYYQAKAQRQNVDVLITNHALICLHLLYPHANILPPYDLLVVDEAHKLPDYARNAIGVELTAAQIRKVIDKAQANEASPDTIDGTHSLTNAYMAEINVIVAGIDDSLVAIRSGAEFEAGAALALTLSDLALEVWADDEMPMTPTDIKASKAAQHIRTVADKVAAMALPGELVRWVDQSQQGQRKLCAAPSNVASFLSKLAGVVPTKAPASKRTHCYRCNRELTAATVHILDGQPYGPDCIRKVDAFGDAEILPLVQWLGGDDAVTPVTNVSTNAVVFCSATLAAPDMNHFLRQIGIDDALTMQAGSPFDYPSNALLYLPNGSTPTPSSAEWLPWMVGEVQRLVYAAKGGAFLLFTSNRSLNHAAAALRGEFERNRLQVFVQGELPKLEIAKQFRQCSNGVLFATKSFFEGVSIDGDALRLVVVDKMPFEAPTPLGTAMEADVTEYGRAHGMTGRKLEMYSFEAHRVPRMVIELKQAAGRLIRTQTDRGVIAVLDSRVRSSIYGRQTVIPSLPPAAMARSFDQVAVFFQERFNEGPQVSVTAVTEEPDIRLPLVLTLSDVDEMPF